jgi:hypothetical protein
MTEWIKVEDRLPPLNTIVMTWGYGCADEDGKWCQAYYSYSRHSGSWQELDCCGDYFDWKPTHWMPLPEAPKE